MKWLMRLYISAEPLNYSACWQRHMYVRSILDKCIGWQLNPAHICHQTDTTKPHWKRKLRGRKQHRGTKKRRTQNTTVKNCWLTCFRKRSEYGVNAESASAMYRATSSTDQDDSSAPDFRGRSSVVELAVNTCNTAECYAFVRSHMSKQNETEKWKKFKP